jgi:large repetitive protein
MRRNLHSLEFSSCWRLAQTSSLNVAKAVFFSFTLLMWSAVSSAQGDFDDEDPCQPVLSITCPPNATVQCENFETFIAVPSVQASGCEGSQLTVSPSDQLLSSSDCVKVYSRTYTAMYGGISESCTQLITVVDQTGPVITAPADLTVECTDPIPGPAEVMAEDACGSVSETDVIVSTSQEAEGSNAGVITRCSLTTPMGPGPDGAIWLNLNNNIHMEAFEMYRWVGSPELIEYPDGTASLTGNVQNLVNAAQGWQVEMFFENKRNWTQWSGLGRSYKDDLGFGAANFQHWDYYELVATFSNLTGTGALAGSAIYLSHQPSNYYFGFQSGIGANNRNGNNGMSGWFFWEGWLNGTWTNGTGDLFTEKQCSEERNDCLYEIVYRYRAQDGCGNNSFATQTITVQDTEGPLFGNCPASLTISCDQPIPAALDSAALELSDACNEFVYLGHNDVEVTQGCTRIITRTYRARDICENIGRCTQVITVVDTVGPVLVVPANATYNCYEEYTLADATATDNCNAFTITEDRDTIPGQCPQEYQIVRNFLATDFCGNSTPGTQTITVVDDEAPVFVQENTAVQVECTEISTVPAPIATDSCGIVTVELIDEVLNSGGCLGVLQRTYIAYDQCNNASEPAYVYITILDTTPPVIENPADDVVECDSIPSVPNINVYDNCDRPVDVQFLSTIEEGECEDSYTIIWRWIATDFCDNVDTAFTFITVIDETDPEFTYVPSDLTLSCDEDVPSGESDMAVATDNCADTVTVSYADEAAPGECPNERTITRTWRAFDNCGNSAMAVQTITVVDDEAPTLEGQAEVVVECGDDVPVVAPTGSDNCADTVLISYIDYSTIGPWYFSSNGGNGFVDFELLPEQITIGGSNSGSLTSIYTAATTVAKSVTISFDWNYSTGDDFAGVNGSTFDRFQYAINGVTTDITENITGGGFEQNGSLSVTVPAGSIFDLRITATDDQLGAATVEVTNIVVEEAPVECPIVDCILRQWTGTDLCGNSSVFNQFIITQDTTPPTITGEQMIPRPCTDFGGIYVQANDECSDVEITYTEILVSGGCTGKYIRTYTAKDECHNETTFEQIIELTDDVVPFVTVNTGSATYECSDDWSEPVVEFDDNCDDMLETSVSVADTTIECVRTITYEFYAEDNCENDTTVTVVITLIDTTRPEIETIGGGDYSCDATEFDLGSAQAFDLCDTSVTVTFVDVQIPGDCPDSYSIERRFTATDDCGNTSTAVVVSTFTDNEAPSLEGQEEVVVECGDDVPVVAPTGSDNCADTVLISYIDYSTIGPWYFSSNGGNGFVDFELLPEQITIGGSNSGSLTSIYTAATTVAKSVTISFDWNYSTGDDFAGVNGSTFDRFQYAINGVTTDITENITGGGFEQNGSLSVTVPAGSIFDLRITATDDQLGAATVEVTNIVVEEAPVECPIVDCILRQWTGTDLCGNSSVFNQFIITQDTTAPVITGDPLITRPCTDFGGIYVQANDECSDVEITYTEILVSGGCTGKYIRTYTAKDECHNETTFEQIIELTDDVVPFVTVNTGSATYECSDDWSEPVVEFDDNCDDMLETSVSVADTTIECVRTITYEFYAEDNCENDTTVTVVITLIDTTRPEIETIGGGDYSCDATEFDLGSAQAFDLCDTSVTVTFVDVQIPGDCPDSYSIERRYTATDDCGNTSSAVIVSTFTDNEAPSLEGQEEVVVECGDDVPVVAPTGSDNCADTVLISYIDYSTIGPWYFSSNGGNGFVDFELLPEQITIGGSNSGSLTSIYTAATTVAKSVTISFDWNYSTGDDFAGVNGSTFDRFQYAINGVTTDITENITGGGFEQNGSLSVTVPAGSIFDLRITATDDQLGAATVEVTNIVVEEAPVECPIVDCILRQWTGTDLCGNSSVFNQFIITQDTTAPVFDPFDVEISRSCSNIGLVSVTASDLCSEVTITPTDVFFSGECQGFIERMYVATDACGNADTVYQIIDLIDTLRPQPTNIPVDLQFECPGAFEDFFPEWTDNCDDSLETTYTNVTDTVECVITITETWTAEDNCGNVNSVDRTITIVDTTAPVWAEGVESFEITIDCGTQINIVAPTATDACNNVNYDTDSERIDGECPAEYTDIFTFVAIDDCGNASDTITYVINTVDNNRPYLVTGVASGSFDCTDVLPTTEPVFADSCSGVEVNFADTLLPGQCPQSYTLIKTWTPVDACGNIGEPYSVVYTVQDNNDPFFNGTVSDEFYQCAPENWVPQVLTASDSCDTNVPVVVNVDDNRDECGNGTIVVNYSAEDDCGNDVYTFYTVYIQDTQAPELSETPENLVLECDQAIPAAPTVTATDNCDDDVQVLPNEVITGETLPAGANARCRLITPDISDATGCQSFYDNTDWALWLGSLPSVHRYFSVVSGDLIQWNDGSVTFNATFANTTNPAWGGFTATVKFVNGKNWAQWSTQSFPTSFKADCGGVDANFQSWMYYILENNPTADLVGYGAYAGSSLNLSHAPVSKYFGFQLGDGANNLTPGSGFGGWFGYSGTVLFNNNPLVSGFTGSGDFSFLLDCCPRVTVTRCWTAEDCTGNMVEYCQTITYEGSTSVVPSAPVVNTEATRGDSQVNIVNMFPNPTSDLTQVQVVAGENTKVTIDVVDMTGRRVGAVMQSDVQPGVIYTFDINAREFNTGLYQVRVMSDKGVSTKQLNVIR